MKTKATEEVVEKYGDLTLWKNPRECTYRIEREGFVNCFAPAGRDGEESAKRWARAHAATPWDVAEIEGCFSGTVKQISGRWTFMVTVGGWKQPALRSVYGEHGYETKAEAFAAMKVEGARLFSEWLTLYSATQASDA